MKIKDDSLICTIRNIATVLSEVSTHLPFLLAIFLLYTIVVTTVDIHRGLNNSANCIICKFTQNLSCGNDTATAWSLSAPARPQTAFLAEYVTLFSKISLSPVGSRSPPSPPPAVEA